MTAIASCHCPTPGGPCPLSKTECSYRLSISQWLARSIAASSADAAELGVRLNRLDSAESRRRTVDGAARSVSRMARSQAITARWSAWCSASVVAMPSVAMPHVEPVGPARARALLLREPDLLLWDLGESLQHRRQGGRVGSGDALWTAVFAGRRPPRHFVTMKRRHGSQRDEAALRFAASCSPWRARRAARANPVLSVSTARERCDRRHATPRHCPNYLRVPRLRRAKKNVGLSSDHGGPVQPG